MADVRRIFGAVMASIETRTSWLVAIVSLALMSTAFGAPYLAVVGLKAIAADVGSARSVPALASSLVWFGAGLGGIAMGRLADRIGVRWTVVLGGTMIAAGLALASRGAVWQLYVGHGVFMGLMGNAGINAPLYVYVSRWFDRRRGTALALISSGQYVAGAVWPPIFERLISTYGWRETMLLFGGLEIAVVVPLAILFLRPPPESKIATMAGDTLVSGAPVFGWPPNLVFTMLCVAAFCCCVPMSMPQGHLVALCSDLGIAPTHGAAMLSVLLGTAFFSRQMWGWISDRVGGLHTVLIGSGWQMAAMTGLILTQDEVGLFTVTAFFGLGFAGIIPAYVLALRELFPPQEAGWRIPTLLLSSGWGMATGGWLAGRLYDYFGYYAPAFATGIGVNALNFVLIATLVVRYRRSRGVALAARA
ncbi:MAG: MFS transporter [Alphaproteobacteria bacterium]|nr:MFS transporter [Alphaproteobacteria bacterium]